MIAEVLLAGAVMCVQTGDGPPACTQVLIGAETPVGTFPVVYVPDGLPVPLAAFAQDGEGRVFAVHVGHTPLRRSLLRRGVSSPITDGCINVPASWAGVLPQLRSITIR